MISVVIAILLIIGLVTVVVVVAEVYAWPADTSEETKNKILTVQSDHELTVEESVELAEDKVFEIFESFPTDSKEHKDLMACGYADKLAFAVLQCYRDKGNDIQ
jgi:hypothetical protein